MTRDLTRGDLVSEQWACGVAEAVDRLTASIAQAGLALFARIDHAAGAAAAGLTMPASVVLIYGAARGGTPVMLAAPDAALDLPLRVLVREGQDGRAIVVHRPIAETLRPFGTPPDLVTRLAAAQRIIGASAS